MTSSATRQAAEIARVEYLTFFVQGEEYALPLLGVREVIPVGPVTRVPQLPPAVRGVTNLRGQVVPVVDLGVALLGAPIEVDRRSCIVLVEQGEIALGLMCEAVGQVLALADDEVLPPPSFGTPVGVELLRGMAAVGKKFALLLAIDRLLASAQLLALAPELTRIDESEPAT